jgi:N-acetylmuramoyl-L-alanine amidase
MPTGKERLSKRLLFLGLVLFLSYRTAAGVTVKNFIDDTEGEVSSEIISGLTYISLTELGSFLGTETSWDQFAKRLTLEREDRFIQVTLFSPYVITADETFNLHYPAEFRGGSIYVPVAFFAPIIKQILPLESRWDRESQSLYLQSPDYNVKGLRFTPKANGLLLEVLLTEPLGYETIITEEGWLNLTIHGGILSNLIQEDFEKGEIIRDLKTYQFESAAQLSFLVKRGIDYRISFKEKPPRILLSLWERGTAPDIFQEGSSWDKNRIDLVVIDPGHGGEDDGAVGGHSGLKEKEVVLDIAKRLAKKLKGEGFKVILTREDDTFLPLGERTQIANRAGADLFISIHANASPETKPRGSETFFLAMAKNDEARAVAALENSAIRFEKPESYSEENLASDLDLILLDMVQNEYLRESSDLAELIQDQFKGHLSIPSRGIDQAGFYVLNRAYMPAVLVEVAFITNSEEERLLRQGKFRQEVAEGISRGLVKFRTKYEGTP